MDRAIRLQSLSEREAALLSLRNHALLRGRSQEARRLLDQLRAVKKSILRERPDA